MGHGQSNSLFGIQNVLPVFKATSLIGIIQFLFGLFQLGRLSILLPPHVVESFTTGAAFYVLTSQVCHVIVFTLLILSPKVKVMLGLGPDHVPRNMHAGRIKIVIFVKYDFQTDIRSIYFMLKVPYILHYVVI